MSVTLGELVDETIDTLLGFTHRQEQVTYLTSTVAADALSLPVADGTVAGTGQVEVGGELVFVDRVAGNTLTVAPFGRGYRSSTAASHPSGTQVTVRPAFPRHRVRSEINNTINLIGADVYSIATGEFTFEPSQAGYELDAATFPLLDDVLALHWDPEDGTDSWVGVKRWRLNKYADPTVFPSGVSLDVFDAILPGATVRVTYKKLVEPFTVDAADSAVFATATGLPETCRDLVVLGAVAALAWGVDLGKSGEQSVSGMAVADGRPAGPSSAMARQLFQKFQFRLETERNRVLALVPVGIRYER